QVQQLGHGGPAPPGGQPRVQREDQFGTVQDRPELLLDERPQMLRGYGQQELRQAQVRVEQFGLPGPPPEQAQYDLRVAEGAGGFPGVGHRGTGRRQHRAVADHSLQPDPDPADLPAQVPGQHGPALVVLLPYRHLQPGQRGRPRAAVRPVVGEDGGGVRLVQAQPEASRRTGELLRATQRADAELIDHSARGLRARRRRAVEDALSRASVPSSTGSASSSRPTLRCPAQTASALADQPSSRFTVTGSGSAKTCATSAGLIVASPPSVAKNTPPCTPISRTALPVCSAMAVRIERHPSPPRARSLSFLAKSSALIGEEPRRRGPLRAVALPRSPSPCTTLRRSIYPSWRGIR